MTSMTKPLAIERICAKCAGRRAAATGACPYCGESAAVTSPADAGLSRSVHAAADAWARHISGAPAHFDELITAIDVRDEVLERVVTEIVRREIRVQRLPSNAASLTTPKIDPATVHPFELSLESLRAQSEYVAPCHFCSGAGLCTCGQCGGAQRSRCGGCDGSGKTLKHYKTTTRLINCKVCRGSGTVKCSACSASGTVGCHECGGGGRQLIWLTYQEQSFWRVSVEPKSLVARAHPQLDQARFLGASDLEAFAVLDSHQSEGPIELEGYRNRDNPILRAVVSEVDPRLERIRRQQYHRLSVVRRDVRFELCGGENTVVLSGRDLDAAPSAASTRLFRRRVNAWLGAAATIVLLFLVLTIRLTGAAAYFHQTNGFIVAFAIASGCALIVAAGGVLRALRSNLKLGILRAMDRQSLVAAAISFTAMLVTAIIARPRLAEVDVALRDGDVPHARQVVTALIETRGDSGDVAAANDAVSFAEASRLSGDQKLAALDHLVARHGPRSDEAAAQARAQRLANLRTLLDEEKPANVLSAIDRWWPSSWHSDADVAESSARAHDLIAKQCGSLTCTFAEAGLAKDAASTQAREDAFSSARADLLAALSTAEVANEATLPRVRRLGQLLITAKNSAAIATTDSELNAAARKAATWATSERAKVALIGAELPVVEELLGTTSATDTHGTFVTIDKTRAFLILDPTKRCRGIYAVGEREGARVIATTVAEQLLSQASGHSATVKRPSADSRSVSRWFEVNAMVAARWKDGQLMELRIGDANP